MGPAQPDAGPYNLLNHVLNATPVATKLEVDEARKKKWESDYLPRVYTVNGQQMNLTEIQAQFRQRHCRVQQGFPSDAGFAV